MPFPSAFQSYLPKTHCVEAQTYGVVIISPFDEVLVVKGRLSDKWGFPKGHGKKCEKPLDAALRELNEEAGIDLSGYCPISEKRFKRNSGKIGGTYFIFHLDFKPTIYIKDTNEISDAMWCPKERLPFLISNMDLKTFCHKKFHMDPGFANLKID
jgi:8-oxo-dGTP pyrophosphatase MutT (NUDIX family)